MVRGAIWVGLLGVLAGGSLVRAADSAGREIPAQLAPFEYMIGGWKGQGVPTANRVRGWSEKHQWAWKFDKGSPVGLSLTLEGDKVLAKAQLTYDAAQKRYVLEGTDPAGKPLTFAGTLDAKGRTLTLDRLGATPEGKERLTLFPNSNQVRYSLWLSRQEPGAPQFKRVIEIGVTKEGESFAAGSAAGDAPKCIITGGAASMTVSFQGKTYPICCTGCRDEFNDNPEKYVKKAALRAEQGGDKKPVKTATSTRAKDDGAFDGLVDEPAAASRKAMPSKSTSPAAKRKAEPSDDEPAAPKANDGKAKAVSRAASQLKIAQNLEKTGKTAAALKYYKQIVKDYPGTPQAKTAAARIKALEAE